jgi:hypothetical protein
MPSETEFNIGRHEAQIVALGLQLNGVEKTIGRMSGKLDIIAMSLAERRGERKAIAFFATAMGGVGSLLVTIALKLWGHQ